VGRRIKPTFFIGKYNCDIIDSHSSWENSVCKKIITPLFIFLLLTAYSALAGEKGAIDMIENIHWLGHDTFKISGGKVIYTDPFNIQKEDAADLILITHEHYDHCSPVDVKKIQKTDTVIVAPPDCAAKLSGNIKTVAPGDKLTVGGIEIEAVPSYNTNKQFHTKSRNWVGYIITLNGQRIYLAGDTDFIPEMRTFKADIALLPVSGTYVMTAEEAVEAALAINPKIAVPMHYNSIVGTKKDAKKFADGLKGRIEVKILKEE
jgi:L-ascorbate metabolism protein UlaG (beta-lactamase superfamily)